MNGLQKFSVITLATAGLGLSFAGPAFAMEQFVAQAPVQYTKTVTDTADVLTSAQEAELEAKIKQLQKDTQKKVYVVFAKDFAGMTGDQWATAAMQKNQGGNVIVFGVSPSTNDYGISYGNQFSSSDQQRIDKAAYDKLVDRDFNGAALALVDAVDGKGSSSAPAMDSSDLGWLGGGAAAVGGLGIGAYAWSKRNRKRTNEAMVTDARNIDPKNIGALNSLPTEVLEQRAHEELVSTDESIRRGREELDIAIAEFGAERARPFTKAMNNSTATLQRAFGLQQRLNDSIPESEEDRRAMLVDIISSCGQADDALDKEAADFAYMRNLLINADTKVEELTRATIDVRTRLPRSAEQLTALQSRYDSSVIARLGDNVELATAALEEAEKSLESARAVVHLPAGEQGRLIEDIRRAETAVQKADHLLSGIEHAEENIAVARDRFPALVAEVEGEIAEAQHLEQQGMATGTKADWEALHAVIAEAREVLGTSQASFVADPLGAYDALVTADSHVDEQLDKVRASAADQARTLQVFDNTARSAASAIQGAEDLIATRGRIVGSTARTQLADAKNLHAQALNIRVADTRQAIDFARKALTAAQRAAASAQEDIDDYRRRHSGSNSNMGGLVTGMILGEMLSGGGGFGGGFGGGYSGGGGGGFGGGGVTGGKF